MRQVVRISIRHSRCSAEKCQDWPKSSSSAVFNYFPVAVVNFPRSCTVLFDSTEEEIPYTLRSEQRDARVCGSFRLCQEEGMRGLHDVDWLLLLYGSSIRTPVRIALFRTCKASLEHTFLHLRKWTHQQMPPASILVTSTSHSDSLASWKYLCLRLPLSNSRSWYN